MEHYVKCEELYSYSCTQPSNIITNVIIHVHRNIKENLIPILRVLSGDFILGGKHG
jgi:hypothetical protein